MKNDQVYIDHILDALAQIETYVSGKSYEEFTENQMCIDAVLREMQIIGEASKRLSEDFKYAHNSIPWKAIAGFRDKTIHDYFDVNVLTVWETIEMDLPILKQELQK